MANAIRPQTVVLAHVGISDTMARIYSDPLRALYDGEVVVKQMER